jgi:predicted regulator of Ras-like GTPase activity (Roadblock/LC7/MglB family)
MSRQDVLVELFDTWTTSNRSIHSIVLCNCFGLPVASFGDQTNHEMSLAAASSSLYSLAENFRFHFQNSSVEYVKIKMRHRKLFVFELQTNALYLMFFVSSPTIEEMRKMTKTVDYIINTT